MIEYLVQQGYQVFAISWRNPDAAQRDWGCDTYGAAILNAMDAVERIAHCGRVHVQASCSGGILASMTAAHLSAVGDVDRLASLTLMVTVLDQAKAGLASAIDETSANIATALSKRKGYLDGRSLAEVLRGCDRPIWCGATGSTTRSGPATDAFRRVVLERRHHPHARHAAPRHGHDGVAQRVDRTRRHHDARYPVDLGTVTTDTYVVAGIADHISPWQACYRSARLLGSTDLRFVLSTSGHIAALVNPPGNPKASYR